jgi:hypothetical protein
MKLHPRASAFAFATIVNMFLECFAGDNFTQGWRLRLTGGSVVLKLDRVIISHHRRSQATTEGRKSPRANWAKPAQQGTRVAH